MNSSIPSTFPRRDEDNLVREILNNFSEVEVWADSDRTFYNMLKECLKAPGLCALGGRRRYAEDLEKDIYNLLEDLRVEPLTQGGILIDSSLVQTFIRFSLYSPEFYGTLAAALDALLSGNIIVFAEIYNNFVESGLILSQTPDESPFAILCADKSVPEAAFTEMAPVFEAFEDESRLLGSFGHISAMICQHWQIRSKERYRGDFEATTRHPMLVIGNSFDPATPLRSAQNISSGFENSVLLEHGGYGVSALSS